MCAANTAAFAQGKPKVAFVPQIVGIPYFNAMEAGGKDAAEKFGVEFVYTGPTDTNPAEQLRIVNNLLDQGVNAVSLSVLDRLADRPDAKLVCVTAITPTKFGEGKTTTSVSVTQGLGAIGRRPVLCLREPSLGPRL